MTVTAAARTLLDDTSTAAMLTTLGAQAAGNYQPLDADLTAISGLVSAADQVIYYTGAGTAALTTVTAAARTVLDDTTIGAMLTTLGGLSAATAATTYAPLASPTLTGVPVAPTAAVGTSTTQIATTAFVNNEAVAKAGDTMTGQLTVNVGAATGGVAIARAAGQQGQIPVYSGAIAGANLRWNMIFADSALEGGSNAGSNFALQRFSDVGAYLGSPLSITRSNGTIVLSGDTTVSSPTAWHTLALGGSANPAINLIPTSGATQQSYIGQSGDQLIFCNSGIANYMQLNLNSGAVTVNASPAVADNSTALATTAYVKSNLASYLTTALATTTYVNATGDTMTGQLTVGPVTGAAVRYHNGTYGAFHWIDAANFHLLLTASGDPLGSYNTLQPFQVALSTGLVTIGNGLAVGGAFTAPTAATADNSTTVATTAYVQANLATGSLRTRLTSGYLLRTNGAGTASTWVGNPSVWDRRGHAYVGEQGA